MPLIKNIKTEKELPRASLPVERFFDAGPGHWTPGEQSHFQTISACQTAEKAKNLRPLPNGDSSLTGVNSLWFRAVPKRADTMSAQLTMK